MSDVKISSESRLLGYMLHVICTCVEAVL